MTGILWLASYPKSGNTWVRILLTNFLRGAADPADIHDLDDGPIASARGMFDESVGVAASDLTPAQVERYRPLVYEQIAAESTVTPFLKIHDAFTRDALGAPSVTPKATAGVLYLVRNPLDVAVSFAFHSGSALDDMIRCMNDPGFTFAMGLHRLPNQLPQRLLTWSGHVRSWLDDSGLPTHVVRYEDLVLAPLETFAGLVAFAGQEPDPVRIAKAVRFSAFDTLKAQETAHGFRERPAKAERFFRQGKIGDWRNHLTANQTRQIVADHRETMIRLGYLSPSGDLLC